MKDKSTPKVKEKYKIENWSSYNEALKSRGSITIWMSQQAIDTWAYQEEREPGGKIIYSDSAIQTCLMIRKVFHLPLRQTEGFVSSLFERLGIKCSVPDYSTLCKRAGKLKIKLTNWKVKGNIDIVIDSTGLKVYGEGEWKVRKHGWSKHRTWRKLHIGVDFRTHEIVSGELTENKVDDAAMVGSLIGAGAEHISSVAGDGAYDKSKSRKQLHGNNIEQIIPPPCNAVLSKDKPPELFSRDAAIKRIAEIGREEWKKEIGYHRRSIAEVAMFRYKTILGDKLRSRKFDNEKTEAIIGCVILNKMTELGMPISRKAA